MMCVASSQEVASVAIGKSLKRLKKLLEEAEGVYYCEKVTYKLYVCSKYYRKEDVKKTKPTVSWLVYGRLFMITI